MKYIIYHHDDNDGHTAGALVARTLITSGVNPKDIIPVELNYPDNFPIEHISKGDEVYIVDISMKESNIKQIFDSILSITKKVMWVDHHDSSVNAIKKYPDYDPNNSNSWIEGIVSKEYCGAYLAYQYLNKDYGFDKIPEWIVFTDLWDSWKRINTEVRAFELMYEKNCSNDSIIEPIWDLRFDIGFSKSYDIVNQMIHNGTPFIEFQDHMFSQIMEASFEVTIDGYRFICVNSTIGNSLLFGDKFNEYDAVLKFSYHSEMEKFVGSMYSHKDSKANVGKICEKLNGGGHFHAAGFKLKPAEMFNLFKGRM